MILIIDENDSHCQLHCENNLIYVNKVYKIVNKYIAEEKPCKRRMLYMRF